MANPSGLSAYTGVPIHKYSTTPQKISTINGRDLYEVVVVTTVAGSDYSFYDITGKHIVSIRGMVAWSPASTILGYVNAPFYYSPTNCLAFYTSGTKLYMFYANNEISNQKLQLIIQYYT